MTFAAKIVLGVGVVLLATSVPLGAVRAQATSGSIFTRNLTIGVSGTDVSALQQFLIDGGFLSITVPTGYFGPLTRSAVGAWQTSVGVYPPAGYFGPLSREKISGRAIVIPTPSEVITIPVGIATTGAATASPIAPSSSVPNGSPVRLIIPSIGVVAGFQYTGIGTDGVIQIPNNIFDVGWYTGSAEPGSAGTAVVTGHVAQIRRSVVTQQGVFFSLNKLRVGDNLYVINDRGETTTFAVREIRSYSPAANGSDVFTTRPGGRELNLISCEGVWNQDQLSFSERLVVFTDAVP